MKKVTSSTSGAKGMPHPGFNKMVHTGKSHPGFEAAAAKAKQAPMPQPAPNAQPMAGTVTGPSMQGGIMTPSNGNDGGCC